MVESVCGGGQPVVNEGCLKILKGEQDEKIENIFGLYRMETAIPVLDEKGKVCYEIRKRKNTKREDIRGEFGEKINRYQKSYYLGKEIVCLQRLLEEQNIVVIGSKKEFDIIFGILIKTQKNIVFLDTLENAYDFMRENKIIILDLQAVASRGRERIYGGCNSVYSWKQFIYYIINIIEGEFCSKFYTLIDDRKDIMNGYLKKYIKGNIKFSSKSIFTEAMVEYMRNQRFHVSENIGEERNNICFTMMDCGKEVENFPIDDELQFIKAADRILQSYRLYRYFSDKVKVLNFVFDETIERTEAEKIRLRDGSVEDLSDRRTKIEDLYNLGESIDREYLLELKKSLRINQKRNYENNLLLLEDYDSRLVNIENGIRRTCYSPEKYEGDNFFLWSLYGIWTLC